MTQTKGRVYANAAGSTVAIAMATEDQRGNKWWLGLPDQEFTLVVLLCHDAKVSLEFVIPVADVASIWSRLSRSGGEVKFNVKRENNRYLLTAGPTDITRFLGSYAPLRG